MIFGREELGIWHHVSVVRDRIHRSSDDFSNESIQQHSYPGLPAILPYLSDSALIYEVERGEFFLDDENWTSLPKLCEEAIRSWWQGQSWREGPLPNDHGISSAIFLHSACAWKVELGVCFKSNLDITSQLKLCEEAIRSWWQGQSWREGPLPNDHGISSAIFLHSACAWKVELGVGFRSNLDIFWCMVSYYWLFCRDLSSGIVNTAGPGI